MALKVKLLARPDHSIDLYLGLREQGLLVDYQTHFAFEDGGLLARLFPRKKRAPHGARSMLSFTLLAYSNNFLGKRLGFNWRKSEAWLAKHLLSAQRLEQYQVVHYWPFYYEHQIRALGHIPPQSRPVTLAEFYEAEPHYVNDLYQSAYELTGLTYSSPINLMIDQNSVFSFEQNFCAASSFTKKSYLHRFPNACIHVVGYGLMGRMVKQVKIQAERRRWVFVGQVCVEKGIHVLLDAMAALPMLSLDLIGPLREGQQEYFQTRLATLGNVRWLGAMSNGSVKSRLADYDAFVLPSLADNYSIAVTEALCEGLPVIVTDHCGNADDVAAYGLGRVCEAGNIAALVAALSGVAHSFDSIAFEQGLRRFEQHEAEQSYAVRVKALYEHLIGSQ